LKVSADGFIESKEHNIRLKRRVQIVQKSYLEFISNVTFVGEHVYAEGEGNPGVGGREVIRVRCSRVLFSVVLVFCQDLWCEISARASLRPIKELLCTVGVHARRQPVSLGNGCIALDLQVAVSTDASLAEKVPHWNFSEWYPTDQRPDNGSPSKIMVAV
jgi:hypothetical protein